MAQREPDSELMLRYQQGDVQAFERLYGRHRGPLYRYFMRHCDQEATAGELFQEVWSRIIQARHRYRPTAKFTTYLYRVAHHCLIDWYRKHKRHQTVSLEPETMVDETDCDPLHYVVSAESLARFKTALEELSFEQREAFLLREEAGLSLLEIAELTGVGRETTKSRLRYAMQKLRAALGPEAEQP